MTLKQSYMLGEVSKDNQLEHLNKLVHHTGMACYLGKVRVRHGKLYLSLARKAWRGLLRHTEEAADHAALCGLIHSLINTKVWY